MKRCATAALLLFVAASAPQNWFANLVTSTQALKAGEYDKALKIDDRILREMDATLGAGDAATHIFAITISHKALALAGLGRNEDAIWYWHEALSLRPSLAKSDIRDYGAPGAFLDSHPLAPVAPTKFAKSSEAPLPGSIVAPKVKTRVEPRYPEGARLFRERGTIIVQSNIGADGIIHDARILQALPAPTMSHAVMEALHRWQFEPALKDGQPVPVCFNLTVNFRLR